MENFEKKEYKVIKMVNVIDKCTEMVKLSGYLTWEVFEISYFDFKYFITTLLIKFIIMAQN